MDTPAIRTCKKCLKPKPLDKEHFPTRKKKSGTTFRWECIDCKKSRDHLYYEEHKQDEHFKKVRTDYVTNNSEYLKLHGQKYRQDHKSREVARAKKWKIDNPDGAKKHAKKARTKHVDLLRKLNQKRRARKKGATIVDDPTLEEIAERDNWVCHICKKKVTRKNWSLDHHFPVGLPDSIHGRQYVSLSHKICNSRRWMGILPAQLHLIDFAYDKRPPDTTAQAS